ncbi:alpha/beta hydrolase [Actinomadura rudentiformis]|uniref:Alpha/beta hydrolase n=1 Tax=Actinomadura rudentiformis TaxID=359158 RepID=A0A6H9Y7X0_9ACTN|nr:alpha/beta hydrolase [Actinomadura rudentiformis]KAB2340014.1 alpha/beta hydrolase [Actinomadura rudentiformis]
MRRSWQVAVLGVALVGASVVVPMALSEAAVKHSATYAYGSHVRQKLDAYWNDPKPGTTQPGLIIIHGGYWNSGARGDWKSAAQWYANRGFAVFSIDHRFNTDAAWPAQRDDATAAIRWIKSRARTFKVHPDRIAVLGSQAGGQLATQVGSQVRGVIGLSPIADPAFAYEAAQTTGANTHRRKIRDQVVVLANCAPSFTEARCTGRLQDMAAAWPVPHYLIHSAGDTVPVAHSERLRDTLARKGMLDVRVQTVPGSSSGGTLWTDQIKTRTLAWLRAKTAARATPPAAADLPTTPAERIPAMRASDDGAVTQRAAARATRIEHNGLAYGRHPRQKIDAYFYKRTWKQPAILMIHGGYWYEGDKSNWAMHARWFADRGYAVFSLNYRFNTQAPWPAQRSDVLAAINWIKSRAATYTLNPSRIVLLGTSAGGHLATNTGTYGDGRKTVKAVAALSPAASPYHAYWDGQTATADNTRHRLRDTSMLLLRCTPDKANTTCWNRWVDAVSFNRASTYDPPMYLIHSQQDFVPPHHSTRLCERLRAKRVPCTARTVAGDAHGMGLLVLPGERDTLLKWINAND